jgi:hypothetical protein
MPRDSIPPLFSVLTIVGLIAGGAYSLFQYFETRARENKTYELQVATAQLEAKKPFYAQHLDLCSERSVCGTPQGIPKRRQPKVDCELTARMRNQNSCYSLGIEIGNQPLPPGFSLNV